MNLHVQYPSRRLFSQQPCTSIYFISDHAHLTMCLFLTCLPSSSLLFAPLRCVVSARAPLVTPPLATAPTFSPWSPLSPLLTLPFAPLRSAHAPHTLRSSCSLHPFPRSHRSASSASMSLAGTCFAPTTDTSKRAALQRANVPEMAPHAPHTSHTRNAGMSNTCTETRLPPSHDGALCFRCTRPGHQTHPNALLQRVRSRRFSLIPR